MTFSGHSLGGGTCIAAAWYRPELVTRIAAFDPCTEWLPDNVRRALFYDYSKGANGYYIYDGGIHSGFEKGFDKTEENLCFGDMDIFLLYSDEWMKNVSVFL